MAKDLREKTPVQYGNTAVKALRFSFSANRICVALHWHNRMEMVRVREGELYVGNPAFPTPLGVGQVYIVPPKTPHYIATNSCSAVYDVIMFDVRTFYNDTPICRKMLESVFDGRATFEMTADNTEITDCFDALYRLANESRLETVATVYRMIDLIFSHCLIGMRQDGGRDSAMKRAADYIRENLAEDISVESLAAHYGYSHEHFCRKFKNEIWLSPMNYLKVCRLEKAAKLLKLHKYRIDEIASLCGFSDQNYFTRCFKAHYGVPPTKYE